MPDPSIPWKLVPGLGVRLRPDGSVVEASTAFVDLLGTAQGGSHWLERLTRPSRDALVAALQTPADFNLTLELLGAAPTWLACSGWGSTDQAHHDCFLSDITANESARQKALELTNRLHLVFNHLRLMVAYFGPRPERRCLFANARYAQLFGLDENSILGLPVAQIIDAALMRDVLMQRPFFESLETVSFECGVRRSDGRHRWLEVTMVPDLDTERRELGTYVLMMDITQEHEAKRSLRESEDRLAKFMEASAEGVIFHRDGLITDVNPAACRLLGEPAGHLLGKETLQLLAPEHRPHARRVITQHSDTAYEGELLTHDGERIPVEVIGRSMLRNGEHLRMAVVRDISDRREAQLRIRELIAGLRTEKDKAEAADRAKSVFLAAASHDLRQPIHALSLFLTALRSMAQAPSVPPGELAEICRRMQASLDGLGQLLNMLLDVSRLDANAVEIARSPTSLAQLFTELDQDFHPLAREKGLRLRVLGSSLWVDTDPTVLRRILANLLSNAVRYTQRGRVLLGCRRRGTDVEIQVWDQGIGIPAEQRDAVFEEFYQIGQAAALRHESHGLGLGLSIVKRSAQLLDAPLNLRSQPGRGSMFCIRVPVCAPPEPCAPKASEASFARAAHGMGVLVIDDDAQVLSAMHSVLSAWGHRVFCALSPDEAVLLAITHTDKINLLISDYRLGGNVTALDAIHAVQACLPRPVPTYILTGDTSPQRIHEASILGFPLLHKPVQASALRNILET